MRKLLFSLVMMMLGIISANAQLYFMGDGTGLSWTSFPGLAVQLGDDGYYTHTFTTLNSFKISTNNSTGWDNGFNDGAYQLAGGASFGSAVYGAGQTLSLEKASANNIETPWEGTYTVKVKGDLSEITLSTSTPQPTDAPEAFIVGGMNGWSPQEAYKFSVREDGNNYVYTLECTINAGVGFKIAGGTVGGQANWGGAINYGVGSAVSSLDGTPVTIYYNGGDTSLSSNFTGTVTLTIPKTAKQNGTISFLPSGAEVKYPDNIYCIGELKDCGWDPTKGLKMSSTGKGIYEAEINLTGSYFAFATQLGSNSSDWSGLGTRYGATKADEAVTLDTPMKLAITNDNYSYKLNPGQYNVTVNLVEMTMTVKKSDSFSYPTTMYVLGNVNGGDWSPTNGVAMNNTGEGTFEIKNLAIGNAGDDTGRFSFTVSLSDDSNNWNGLGQRYGAETNDLLAGQNGTYNLAAGENSFQVGGDVTLDIALDLVNMKITISNYNASTTTPEPEYPETMYIIGTIDGNGWNATMGSAMGYEGDGIFILEDVVLKEVNGNTGFSFVTDLAEYNDDGGWTYINERRYGPEINDTEIVLEDEFTVEKNANSWTIKPGKYTFTLDLQAMTLVVEGEADETDPNPEPGGDLVPFEATYNFTTIENLQAYNSTIPDTDTWSATGSNTQYGITGLPLKTDNLTATFVQNTGSAPVVYRLAAGTIDVRMYQYNNLTISAPEGGALKSISFTTESTQGTINKMTLVSGQPGTFAVSSSDNKTMVWTAPEGETVSTIQFTTGGNTRIATINVTGEAVEGGDVPDVPTPETSWVVNGNYNDDTSWSTPIKFENYADGVWSTGTIEKLVEFKLTNDNTWYGYDGTGYAPLNENFKVAAGDEHGNVQFGLSGYVQNAVISFNPETLETKVTGTWVSTALELYLRGDISGSDWPALDDYKFSSTDGNVYTLTVDKLEAGSEFKIASASWSPEYTTANTGMENGTYNIVSGGNMALGKDMVNVTLTLDIEKNTLTIAGTESGAATLYLYGSMNDPEWKASDDWKFETEDGVVYTLEGVSIPEGAQMKIANGSWTESYTYTYTDANILPNKKYTLVNLTGDQDNMTMGVGVENATVNYNLTTHEFEIVVKRPDAFYMISEANGWGEGVEMPYLKDEPNFDGENQHVYQVTGLSMNNPLSFALSEDANSWVNKFGCAENGEFTTATTLEAKSNGGNFVNLTNLTDITLTFYYNPAGQSWLQLEGTEPTPEVPEYLYIATDKALFGNPVPADGDQKLTWDEATETYVGTATFVRNEQASFRFYTDAENLWTPANMEDGELVNALFDSVESGTFEGYTILNGTGRWYISVWPAATPDQLTLQMTVDLNNQTVEFIPVQKETAPDALYLWGSTTGPDSFSNFKNLGTLVKADDSDTFTLSDLVVPECEWTSFDPESGAQSDGKGLIFFLNTVENNGNSGLVFRAPEALTEDGNDTENQINLNEVGQKYTVIAAENKQGRDFIILNPGTYSVQLDWTLNQSTVTVTLDALPQEEPALPTELRVATININALGYRAEVTPSDDDPVLTYDATSGTFVGEFEWLKYNTVNDDPDHFTFKRIYSVDEAGTVTYYGPVTDIGTAQQPNVIANRDNINLTTGTANSTFSVSEVYSAVGGWALDAIDTDASLTLATVKASVDLSNNSVEFTKLNAEAPEITTLYFMASTLGNGSADLREKMTQSTVDENVYEYIYDVPAGIKKGDDDGGGVSLMANGETDTYLMFFFSTTGSADKNTSYMPTEEQETLDFTYDQKVVTSTWEKGLGNVAIATQSGKTKFSFNVETLEFKAEYLDEIAVPEDGLFFTSPFDMTFTYGSTPAVDVELPVSIRLDDASKTFQYAGFQFDLTLPDWLTIKGYDAATQPVAPEGLKLGEGLSGEITLARPNNATTNVFRVVVALDGDSNDGSNLYDVLDNIVTFPLEVKAGSYAWDANDKTYFTFGSEVVNEGLHDVVISDPAIFSTGLGKPFNLKGFEGSVNVIINIPSDITDVTIDQVEIAYPSYSESTMADDVTVGESLDITLTVTTEPESDEDVLLDWTADVDGVDFSYDETTGHLVVDTSGVVIPDGQDSVEITITGKYGDKEWAEYTFTVRGVLYGDSNDDQHVDVADVVTTANYIASAVQLNPTSVDLGEWVVRFDFPNANVMDVADDEIDVITVSDLNATVNIALGIWDGKHQQIRRKARTIVNSDRLVADDFQVRSDRPFSIGVGLDNTNAYSSIQTMVEVPAGMTVKGVTAGPRIADHSIAYNVLDNGNVQVVIYSPSNAAFRETSGALFNLVVTAEPEVGDLNMVSILAADAAANGYSLEFEGGLNGSIATGIDGIDADDSDVRYFTVDGLEVFNPEKGQILIRIEGDKAEKVVIK